MCWNCGNSGHYEKDCRQKWTEKCSHPSRTKILLVKMSASWPWVSKKNHLDHRTILSSNQSSATVGAGCVSHRRTLAFDDQLDHCLIALKILQQKHYCWKILKRFAGPVVYFSHLCCTRFSRAKSRCVGKCNTSMTKSHVFKEMIWDSLLLCETAVCFWHIKLIGTNVWLPRKTHDTPRC